jgi:hypothetical protein
VKEALAWDMPVYMRNLSAYCGEYDNNSLVHYINNDIEDTCRLLCPRDAMGEYLAFAYEKAWSY